MNKRVTCQICKRKRTKAVVKNPFTGQERRTPKNICGECHPHVISQRFFQSSFGKWFHFNALRHCTNSIPVNTEELKELYFLWRERKFACGLASDGDEVKPIYEYELCHIDPAKGNQDFRGKLVASNLIIAPKSINRGFSNTQMPFTRNESAHVGEPINEDNFRDICEERYELNSLVIELGLSNKSNVSKEAVFQRGGREPALVLARELNRHGYKAEIVIQDSESGESADMLVADVFDTFFKVGGVIALAQLEKIRDQSRTLLSFELEYDRKTHYERQLELRQSRKLKAEPSDF